MTNYREYGMHFMTIILLIMVPFFVIPNLSTNLKNYKKETNIIIGTRINIREYTGKYFQKKTEKTLVIILKDSSEIKLSDVEYHKYWDIIEAKNNIGKKITFYSGNNTAERNNPVQIEIDNKIIYDPSESVKWGYIIVFMTIGMTIYSGIKLRNYFQYKDE
jgi:hypothetical protein